MAVDEVVVRAVLRDDLSKPLAGTRREVERFERSVDKAGRSSLVASRSFTGMGSHLRAVDGQLRTVSASIGHLAAQSTRLGAIGLGTLGVAAAGFGLKAEAGFERSRIAFGTLLESVEGGNRLFADLQAYNLKTPFELGEISAATQTLLQFDVAGGNVLPTLKSISDIAATTSAPGENLNRIALALGQISSAGVLRGQDLNQLVQAGFPAYQLLTQITGQTTAELRQQMETGLTLPAEEFIAALNEGGGVLAKFASGAEAQSRTLSGVFSNLKDTLQVQLAEGFEPLAEGLSETLPAFSATLGTFIDGIAPPLSRIGLLLVDSVGKLLPIIEPPLVALLDGLGTLLEAMTPAFVGLEPVMGDLSLAIGEMVTALVPVMPDLVEALVAVVGVLPDMVRLLTDFVPLVRPLANLVENLAEMEGAAGVLLVTLLGYRALSSIATGVFAMAEALTALHTARNLRSVVPPSTPLVPPIVPPVAPASRGGRFGRLGAGLLAAGLPGVVAGSVAALGTAGVEAAGGDRAAAWAGPLGTLFGIDDKIRGGAAPPAAADRRWAASAAPTGGAPGAVQVGQITVNNPTSNVDVSRAVAAGIAEERRTRMRRE